MQKDEANQIMQENDLVSKNVDEIGELSQHDDDMLTEEISFSVTYCICLKKTNDAHTCTKCYPKIRMYCSHISKENEIDILSTPFFFFLTKNSIEGRVNS